jgi:alkylation response protein AidB-like acyl-CoA dehydrogenase
MMVQTTAERSEVERLPGGGFLLHDTKPEALFTPEDFSEEERMMGQAAEEFVRGEVLPRSEAIERQEPGLLPTLMRDAGRLGLLGVDVPPEYEGLGSALTTSALIAERMAPQASFAVTFGAHTGIATLPIVFFGTPDQKKRYLPRLATGEWVAAYALSEADSGSDALAARTRAVLNPAGTHYVLTGTKMWISNAAFAGLFVLFAKVDGDKFTAFLVEHDTPGLSLGREEHKVGIKGSSTRRVILEEAAVPKENVLGEVGRGHIVAFNALNLGRFKLAASGVGGAKASLAAATRYAQERRQFGQPIASFGMIQQKLGEMATRLYACESALYRTAGLMSDMLHSGVEHQAALEEYAVECSILKVTASEMLDFVVDEAVQIHGGYGFTEEFPVARAFRDQRINRIFEGTNEINRLFVPTMLLRRAERGRLPLIQETERLRRTLGSLPAPEGHPRGVPLEAEARAIAEGKKLALLVAGAAIQRFGDAIGDQQEILGAVSDMIADLFLAESAVLRAQKADAGRQTPDASKGGRSLASDAWRLASALFVNDMIGRLETRTREVMAALAAGDELRAQLSALRRFTRWTPVDTIALRRQIAAEVLAKEGYPG